MSQQHGGGPGGEPERKGQRPEGRARPGGRRRRQLAEAQEEGLGREGSQGPQAGMHDHSQ